MIDSGIYIIKSKIKQERFYIGNASNLEKRKSIHFSNLKYNKHHSIKFQRHYNKYGKDDFVFEIIEYVEKLKLIEREQYWLDELNPWFNISPTANSPLGIKRSKEFKEKMSKIMMGHKNSKESNRKNSESHKGENNHFFGKKHSAKSLKKISESSKGRIPSQETRLKMSQSQKGIKHSEQTKKKMSDNSGSYKRRKPVLQFDLDGNFIAEFESFKSINEKLGFDISYIIKVAKNKNGCKSAYNYMWRYKNVEDQNYQYRENKKVA